jgi:hypothetical protein
MIKWEAIVAVVQSFNDHKRPGFALAAVMVLPFPVFGVAAMVVSLLR